MSAHYNVTRPKQFLKHRSDQTSALPKDQRNDIGDANKSFKLDQNNLYQHVSFAPNDIRKYASDSKLSQQ